MGSLDFRESIARTREFRAGITHQSSPARIQRLPLVSSVSRAGVSAVRLDLLMHMCTRVHAPYNSRLSCGQTVRPLSVCAVLCTMPHPLQILCCPFSPLSSVAHGLTQHTVEVRKGSATPERVNSQGARLICAPATRPSALATPAVCSVPKRSYRLEQQIAERSGGSRSPSPLRPTQSSVESLSGGSWEALRAASYACES